MITVSLICPIWKMGIVIPPSVLYRAVMNERKTSLATDFSLAPLLHQQRPGVSPSFACDEYLSFRETDAVKAGQQPHQACAGSRLH